MARKKHFHPFGIFLVIISLISLATTSNLTDSTAEPSSFAPEYLKPPRIAKLNKFSLTQKGYIQFLRYITPVPPIGDFTFCIWIRSENLTYAHPLLSYSRHEEERFIRAWITAGGEEIRLAVREIEIINVPVALKEKEWYHICQSWSTKTGHWNLFLNGKLKSYGYNNKARGQILPKDGDIVVGQEYTDFDKGLDDGIEGDIFGFNMVLTSATALLKSQRHQKEPTVYSNRRMSMSVPQKIKGHYIVASGPLYLRRISKSVRDQDVSTAIDDSNKNNSSAIDSARNKRQAFNLFPYSYVRVLPTFLREKLTIKPINPYFSYSNNQYGQGYQPLLSESMLPPLPTLRNKNSRIANDISAHTQKPLGLQLVEMSFKCDLGKGAPLKGKDVLISWTKTPVRVFGGATLKKVEPFCY